MEIPSFVGQSEALQYQAISYASFFSHDMILMSNNLSRMHYLFLSHRKEAKFKCSSSEFFFQYSKISKLKRINKLFLQMNRLESKVNQLDTLHKRHIARPSFDEKNSEEDEIKAITKEVSEVKTFFTFFYVQPTSASSHHVG